MKCVHIKILNIILYLQRCRTKKLLMGQNFITPGRLFSAALIILLISLPDFVSAQTYNDGPIQLQGRLREFNLTFSETDIGFFGLVGQPDDLTYYVWMRDAADLDNVTNPSWGPGSGCLTESYQLPLNDWNTVLFNYTYASPQVPQFMEIRLDAWEDESPDQVANIGCGGTRCAFDLNFCCGATLFGNCLGLRDDDDLRCDGQPYQTLDYRLGSPCEWYNHGNLTGNCANDVYHPRIETYWRYTRGDLCTNAIQFGNINPGFAPITHFNSNECYTNQVAYTGGGQDVVYEIQVANPIGINVNTCGTGSASTDVLILDNTCSIIFSNSGGCGSGADLTAALCIPGTYYIVVEGRLGDTGTFTLELQEDPSAVVDADAGPDVSVCSGQGVSIGAIAPSFPAFGGTPPYVYNWVPNTFLTSNTDSITTAFPPTTTDYVLEVTDASGCVARDTVTVTVNPGPNVNIGPDLTVCPGTPVFFNAGPGYSAYFWNTGSFNQTITVNQPGTYIAVATDLAGCIGRDTAVLSNFPISNVNIGPDTSICLGTSITLSAGTGFNLYNWSTTASTPTIPVSIGGNYQVTVTDVNGCEARDSIVVEIDSLPIPNLPATVTVCPGDDAVLNPGAGYPGYNWAPTPNINQILITNQTGSYTVTVTDGNGCEGIATTTVTNFAGPAPFNISAPSSFLCDGSSMVLTANAGGAISGYTWSTGSQTNTATITQAGDYFLTVTTSDGCEYYDTVSIGSQPQPVVELGPDTTICQGSQLVLNGPAGPNFNYIWSTGGTGQTEVVTTPQLVYLTVTNGLTNCTDFDSVNVAVVPSPTPTPLTNQLICQGDSVLLDPGGGFTGYSWNTLANSQVIWVSQSGTYEVTVTNAAGCEAVTSMNLTVLPAPTVSIAGGGQGCENSSLFLEADPGFATYQWSNGHPGRVVNALASGTYTVTATDVNGCQAVASQVVTINPLPVVDLGPTDTLCDGATIDLDAGPGFVSYAWSNSGTNQIETISSTGTYTVTVTDANGCQNTSSIDIIASTTAPVDLPPTITICDRGSILLDAGPDYIAYNWTGGGMSMDQFLLVDQPGVYSVTVVDQFGCSSTDDVTVIADGVVPLDFLADTMFLCPNDQLILDAGDQWLFYVWDGSVEDQYLVVNTPGDHDVVVTDANGCRFSDMVTVVLETPPTLDLGPLRNICPEETLTVDAGPGFDSYLWSNGATTQTIEVTGPGEFAVTTTYRSCTLTDATAIGDDCPGQLFVPNVFSPNDDGINDFFEVTYVNMEYLEIFIYDRWGKLQYTSMDKNFRWNGTTSSGRFLPEGVFYYVITYKLATSEFEEETKGTVTIIR